ncbi:MAG: hypothetical protein AMXMBFR64_62700 [Myxococcales bacterium]
MKRTTAVRWHAISTFSFLTTLALAAVAAPAEALVFVGTQAPNGLRVLTDGGAHLKTISLPAAPVAIEATWNGDRVFVAHGAGGQIRSVNPLTGAFTGPVVVNDARHLALSPTGNELYVAAGVYGVVFVNTANLTYSGQVHVGFPVDRVEVSPNGSTIHAIGATGVVNVDAANRWTTQATSFSSRTILASGLAPGGTTLYVAHQLGVDMFATTTLSRTSANLNDTFATGIGFRWDGGVLYTSHAATNRVAANMSPPFFLPTTFQAVGAAPRALTVTKTGYPDSWVVAANTGSNSLSFVQTQGFGAASTVALGAQPVALDATWSPSFFSVSPGSLEFTYAGPSQTSSKTVTVTNHSGSSVPLGQALLLQVAQKFPITANSCSGQTLPPGASCTISVACAPAAGSGIISLSSTYSSTLQLQTNPALQTVLGSLSCKPLSLSIPSLSLK